MSCYTLRKHEPREAKLSPKPLNSKPHEALSYPIDPFNGTPKHTAPRRGRVMDPPPPPGPGSEPRSPRGGRGVSGNRTLAPEKLSAEARLLLSNFWEEPGAF